MSLRARVPRGRFRAVMGNVFALVVLVGCEASVPATLAPTTVPTPSVAPTSVAVESPAPSAEVTAPPVTEAPSAAPTAPPATEAPAATSDPNPAIVFFRTPKQEDCTNDTAGSVHVSWQIERASGVTISIDGPGIYDEYAGLTGEIDLPYGCDHTVLKHTYTLKTVGGNGQWVRVTHTIRTRAPSITSFSVGTPSCEGGASEGVPMSYEVRAATGADLERDGSPYSTYGTKASDDIVIYDCTKSYMTFRLTTTGGYGPAASRSITVYRPVH